MTKENPQHQKRFRGKVWPTAQGSRVRVSMAAAPQARAASINISEPPQTTGGQEPLLVRSLSENTTPQGGVFRCAA